MNNRKVNFFFVAEPHWSGASAYACHMILAFEKMGYDVQLLKITPKGENKVRSFASGYEKPIHYRNISIRDALNEIENTRYNHIVCAQYMKKFIDCIDVLLDVGCSIMLHTAYESVKYNFCEVIESFGHVPIVPRTSMASFVGGHLIPYPYNISIQKGDEVPLTERPYDVMSGARLSQTKSSGILFDVNEMLIKDELSFQYKEHDSVEGEIMNAMETVDSHAIHLYGSFEKSRTESLSRKYEYKDLPRGIPFYKKNFLLGEGPGIMSNYIYVIDLSNYLMKGKTVGSGDISNFAMFEAYDAGSVIIVHKDWLDAGIGLMDGMNCIAVSGADELYDALQDCSVYYRMLDIGNYQNQRKVYLERCHSPEFIVPKYINFWENM